VGPQGSGKTTHARLLSQMLRTYTNVCLTHLNSHAFPHILFTRVMDTVVCRLFHSCIKSKFYENLPPTTLAPPKLYIAVFPIILLIHMLSYVISRYKLSAYLQKCNVIIDQEGYLIKQASDIFWLASYARLRLNKRIWEMLIKFLLYMILHIAELAKKYNVLIVLLHCDYKILVERYYKRRKVEPHCYVNFQYRFYSTIVQILKHIVINLRFITVFTDKPLEQPSKIWYHYKFNDLELN